MSSTFFAPHCPRGARLPRPHSLRAGFIAPLLLAALACAAPTRAAPTTPPTTPPTSPAAVANTDPLNAQAQVPALRHRPALGSYQRWRDQEAGSWREANERVARIGGWRVYTREALAEIAAAEAAAAAGGKTAGSTVDSPASPPAGPPARGSSSAPSSGARP